MQPYLEHVQYAEIIRNVNYIIQKSIYKQKYYEPSSPYSHYFAPFLFSTIFILLVCTCAAYAEADLSSPVLMILSGLMIAISLILILGFSLNSYHEEI